MLLLALFLVILLIVRPRRAALKGYAVSRHLETALILLSLLASTVVEAKEDKLMSADSMHMKIIKPESQPASPAPAGYFTGSVHLTPLAKGEEPSCLSWASVSFDPGTRSAWHTHPRGQLLMVTDGTGLIQEWGKPVQRIKKGDVIWTPPGVKHWHGAAPTTSMTHTAIQEAVNGKNVDWMEKVSDQQYSVGVHTTADEKEVK
jgi:quercetin dioxygenase-like cupin family protein